VAHVASSGVGVASSPELRRIRYAASGGDCGQADGGIVAETGEGFQTHVSPLHRPFVVLLEQMAPTRRLRAAPS
jgi:hypothetical protein